MKRSFVVTLIVSAVFLYGCSYEEYYNKKSKFSGDTENRLLIEKLETYNIRHKVYSDGYIGFNEKDENIVDKLKNEIVNDLVSSQAKNRKPERRTWFVEPYHTYLVKKLNAKNINYSINIIDYKKNIIWEEKDNDIVVAVVNQFVKDIKEGKLPSNKSLKNGTREELRAP